MTVRPIIFSGPMIRALLEGRKTQTRRLAWRGRKHPLETSGFVYVDPLAPTPWQRVKPGDLLWVRERTHIDGCVFNYAADCDPRRDLSGLGYEPSIHMPRKASRLTLEVTNIRRELLRSIDNYDARAEGVDCWPDFVPGRRDPFPALRFRDLWATLHGMDSWDANPEVVALTFAVHRQNIDTMKQREAA